MEEVREPETWKPIPGYEGLYEVSSWGRVRRVLILSGCLSRSGYPTVSLQVGKKVKYHGIHLLVAESFLEKEKYQNVVNHKDSNIENNSKDNLEWVSIRENVSHSKKGDNYTSKYIGVWFYAKSGKWMSSISVKGKRVSLGSFLSEEKAALVYRKALDILNEDNIYHLKGLERKLSASEADKLIERMAFKEDKKYKSVSLTQNKKRYQSVIFINKVRIFLGTYDTPKQAYQSYVNYIVKHNLVFRINSEKLKNPEFFL